jgi:hypothetical protein
MLTTMTRSTDDPTTAPARPGDIYPDDALVVDLTASLRTRVPSVPEAELEDRVRAALQELAPVRVTSYLGVLVERKLRASIPAQRA